MFLPTLLLAVLTAADKLTRSQYLSISLILRPSPSPSLSSYSSYNTTNTTTNNTTEIPISISITDTCIAPMGPGACNQDTTYLKPYTNHTADGAHTFRYHRNLLSADAYEWDGSGKRKVPVREAKDSVEDVNKGLDGDAGGETGLRAECQGVGCKAQWFKVPDL
ncbi:hypothetical protein CC80DRAFT_500766 [Byssothecium circinans]|uniref:Uncharacterized protein n=1 Tax=Byssothecium circinans TaxID=147558 RepID=A0A6A5UKA7_9PLEO|nr:hypothetical protein CC80DRAFT_500766 [Byssothecium circinans]